MPTIIIIPLLLNSTMVCNETPLKQATKATMMMIPAETTDQ